MNRLPEAKTHQPKTFGRKRVSNKPTPGITQTVYSSFNKGSYAKGIKISLFLFSFIISDTAYKQNKPKKI